MIVVFDSSVWISAIQFGGTPLKALDSATGRCVIAICKPILAEVRSVLRGKFRWPTEAIETVLAEYAPEMRIVSLTGVVRDVCRDPKDDMVIECAVLAGANWIISGDKDLLSLGGYEGIRVLTPRAFLDEISRTASS